MMWFATWFLFVLGKEGACRADQSLNPSVISKCWFQGDSGGALLSRCREPSLHIVRRDPARFEQCALSRRPLGSEPSWLEYFESNTGASLFRFQIIRLHSNRPLLDRTSEQFTPGHLLKENAVPFPPTPSVEAATRVFLVYGAHAEKSEPRQSTVLSGQWSWKVPELGATKCFRKLVFFCLPQ